MGRIPDWVRIAVLVPSLFLTCVIGLLVVFLVRPKNRAAAVAAGGATGLLGGLAAFALGGGWLFVVGTTLYTPNHKDSDLWLLSKAARMDEEPGPGMAEPGAKLRRGPAERLLEKYPDLRAVPAQERGRVLYYKIMADWSAGIPIGIGLGLISLLSATVAVSVAETLAASILLRRLGRVRAVIWPYIELAVPGVLLIAELVGGSWRLFAGWFTGHGGQLLILLVALVLLVLAITAVLRGWHWLVRSFLHLGWLGSVGVYMAIEMVRFRAMGG
jgi:hypothetical protein